MNKVQEYFIKKQAQKDAIPYRDSSDYHKNLVVNEALTKIVELQFEKIDKERALIRIPDARKRVLDEETFDKILLTLGGIGITGAIAGNILTGNNDLCSAVLSTTMSGTGAMVAGCVGAWAYQENLVGRIITGIKRKQLKNNIANLKQDIAKEKLYKDTLESELEMN